MKKALFFNFTSALTSVIGVVLALMIGSAMDETMLYFIPLTAGGIYLYRRLGPDPGATSQYRCEDLYFAAAGTAGRHRHHVWTCYCLLNYFNEIK